MRINKIIKTGFVHKLVLLVAALVIVPHLTMAQQEGSFTDGLITKKDNTTIKCLVEVAVAYYHKVDYKFTPEGEIHPLKISEIKSIQTQINYIENITLHEKELLMLRIAEGKVSLFNHVTVKPLATNGGSKDIYFPPTIVYVVKRDGKYYEIKKKNYASLLSVLMTDQPSVVSKIKNKQFKFENIKQAVNEYNLNYRQENLTRQITVKVIDSENKKPIKDAKVIIRRTDQATISNYLGYFQLTIDPLDTLEIRHPEYQPGFVNAPESNSFQIALTKTAPAKE